MHTRPHEKLIVWQEAYRLCLKVYQLSKELPKEERFGLQSQMRRAAYSVPLNIAEGNAKSSPKERARFCEIAQGSLEELHCQCMLSKDLGYLIPETLKSVDDHIQRVSYLLGRLRQALKI